MQETTAPAVCGGAGPRNKREAAPTVAQLQATEIRRRTLRAIHAYLNCEAKLSKGRSTQSRIAFEETA